MKNKIFNGIILEELANVKMCMSDTMDLSITKLIVLK